MKPSLYLLIAGLILVLVGLLIRFAPLVTGRWRLLAAIVIVPFATVPRSWMPLGLAFLALGFALLAPPPVAAVLLVLFVMLFAVGVLFAFWAPGWMQPRSLRPPRTDESE
jgi:hypothetical protein